MFEYIKMVIVYQKIVGKRCSCFFWCSKVIKYLSFLRDYRATPYVSALIDLDVFDSVHVSKQDGEVWANEWCTNYFEGFLLSWNCISEYKILLSNKNSKFSISIKRRKKFSFYSFWLRFYQNIIKNFTSKRVWLVQFFLENFGKFFSAL